MKDRIEIRRKEREEAQTGDPLMRQYYRNVFSSHEGQKVFEDLLKDMSFFETADTEEERILRNHAVRIVDMLNDYKAEDVAKRQVKAILSYKPDKHKGGSTNE